MSAIIFGTKTNQILPQPDFSASKSSNGGWTASQSFIMKRGDMDNTAIRALFPAKKRATELDTNLESFFKFLKLSSIDNISNLPGGFTSVRVNYAGFQSNVGDFGTEDATEEEVPTYSRRGAIRQEPLYNHPKWIALEENEKIALGKLLTGEWKWGFDPEIPSDGNYTYVDDPKLPVGGSVEANPIKSENAIKFAELISQGQSTYDRAGFTWTKRWQSTLDMTGAQLASLGKITNPPGNPTTPTGTRDWIMVSADTEQTGDENTLYTHEITFDLSEEGGHNSFLYES